MRIEPINNSSLMYDTSTVETVQANLEALAAIHRVSVPELLDSAHAVEGDPNAPSYLIRALNLESRLEKLSK